MKKLIKIRWLVFLIVLTFSFNLVVESQCIIYSSLIKNTACRKTSVKFRITDTLSSYAKILWEFGDGKISTLMASSVIHLYDTFGVFKVKVTTYYPGMNIKCKDSIMVTVVNNPNNGPQPHLRIIGDTSGCPVFVLQVKDSSKNVDEWEFYLGDSMASSFKIRNPGDSIFNLQYKTPGTYWMSVLVMDSVYVSSPGIWVQCTSIYGDTDNPFDPHFKVTVYKPSHSSFTPTDTTVYSKKQVEFTPICDKEFDSVSWNFADTFMTLPVNQKARHTYVLPQGTHDTVYQVMMLAYGALCGDGPKDGWVRVIDSTVIEIPEILLPEIHLKVWPNPVTDKLIISGKNSGNINLNIKIYNSMGELLVSGTCINKTFINQVIDMSNLPSGIYYLEIGNNNSKETVKLFKE